MPEQPFSEEQIERMVEKRFDRLDARLMSGGMTQEEYDEEAKIIAAWADHEYEIIARMQARL